MASYAVGDIQGCFSELQALLKLIQFNPQHDTLWITGDLVNRGPQSLEVLRFVKALGERAIVVLGNHDLHLLAVACGQQTLQKSDTLAEIINAPDGQAYCAWLRQQPLIHYDQGYVLVHAGILPQWTLQDALNHAREVEKILRSDKYPELFRHMYGDVPNQWSEQLTGWERVRMILNVFTRMRFCDTQGTLDLSEKGLPSAPPSGFMPWFKIPSPAHKDLKIIFGHWAALNGQADEPHVYALDTGCAWGNCLTALRLEDGRRFSVPCAKI